jgi:hypothetical protein
MQTAQIEPMTQTPEFGLECRLVAEGRPKARGIKPDRHDIFLLQNIRPVSKWGEHAHSR